MGRGSYFECIVIEYILKSSCLIEFKLLIKSSLNIIDRNGEQMYDFCFINTFI